MKIQSPRTPLILGLGIALVAAGVGAVLAQRRAAPAKEAAAMSGTMTREDAVRMAKGFLAAKGVKNSPGLNDKNFGGAELEGDQLFFEYLPDKKVLRASAVIYRFKKDPKPGVWEGFLQEEQSGTDTGGGALEFEPKSRCLLLTRTYVAPAADAQFVKDMDRLVKTSRTWANEVLDRVASRVFHPEELKK